MQSKWLDDFVVLSGASHSAEFQIVKDSKEIALVVLKKLVMGCDMNNTFYQSMPGCIEDLLLEFKDIFSAHLPPSLHLVQMGHDSQIELEERNP